jgi:RimJ/RimL family protein N-acetyltransferase
VLAADTQPGLNPPVSAGEATQPWASLWPIAGLRLQSGPFELRTPSDADLAELAQIYPADVPFDPTLPVGPGTREQQAAQAVLRHAWRARAELSPARWRLCFAAYAGGVPVGQQDLKAAGFPGRRIVETSSWVGKEFRGRGYGKAMRALVLHLAFEGLGAVAAESESAEGNDAALGVTRSLGYDPCGDTYAMAGSKVEHRLWARLTRERWSLIHQGYSIAPIAMQGLEPCLPLLGLDEPSGAGRPPG